jgi:hypothetical protein
MSVAGVPWIDPVERARLERSDLVARFERAAEHIRALTSSDESTSAALLSDNEPDVAFLLHAVELLFVHQLRVPLLTSLLSRSGALSPWAVLRDAALFDKGVRALVDEAARRARSNLARGRVVIRLALNHGDVLLRLVRIVAESALGSANYEPTATLRHADAVARILQCLSDILSCAGGFRVDEVPLRVDQGDFWRVYVDELEATRQVIAMRAQRAETLLRSADDELASPTPSAPASAELSLDDGIDKSLVFRSSDQRKVRSGNSRKNTVVRVVAPEIAEPEVPPQAPEVDDVPLRAEATPPTPPMASVEPDVIVVTPPEPEQELHRESSLAENEAPPLVEAHLSDADLRQREEADLDAILTLAVNRSFGAEEATAREEPVREPLSRSPPAREESESPPTTPKAVSSLSDSYKYAYISSALMGATPPSGRARANAEVSSSLSPLDLPSTPPASEPEAPTSAAKLSISFVDDYEPEVRRQRAMTDSRVPVEARGSKLFLERRHRPSDKLRNEACYGCQRALRFSRLGDEARYCFFFGHYFCAECHLNEWRAIPARAVLEWDWKLRKVSTAAASHIDRLWQSRQIDCALVPDAHCRALPTYLLTRQRVARVYVAALHECPARAPLLASDEGKMPGELLLALDDAIDAIRHEDAFAAALAARDAAIRAQPGVLDHAALVRAPLVELLRRFCDEPLGGCVHVSLAELAELRTKAPPIVMQLAVVAGAFERHVSRECTRCLLLGASCPKCSSGNLFDWTPAAERCAICLMLFHRTCLADANSTTCDDCFAVVQRQRETRSNA